LVNGSWKVVDGLNWLMDFAGNEANAREAADIIKFYGMNKMCFVGRPNPPMMYFTVNGQAPSGAYAGEDAIGFSTANIEAKNVGGRWKVVDGPTLLLDFNTEESQARVAVALIKMYGFNKIAFVGRPNSPMMYFRK
jgi:hypothetical protein